MVAIVGEAGVKLRPEASGFAKEADSQVSGELPGVAKKAAGFFAAAFAAVAVGSFFKDAVGAASDLSESTSKVGVVFGDASQQVLDFASNASTAFGQSKGQALEAAGTFGNLLRSIGLTEQASADMSTKMVGLASDLASFNNTDPAEALDALRAGLTGETEPLKRYGINLNDATLKAEALRLGLDASGATLSANTKAQAAYSLIMTQSSLAQGDFARTAGGLANQQRIMASQWVDLSANIGGLFVPVLGNASGLLTGHLMPALLRVTSALPDLGNALGAIGDYVRAGFNGDEAEGLAGPVGRITEGMQNAAYAAGNFGAIFGEAMADGRAGASLLKADGIDGLAARAGVAAFRVRQDLGAAFLSVQATASPLLDHLFDSLRPAIDTVKAAIGQMFSGLGGGGGGGGLAGFASMIGGALNQVLPLIMGFVEHWIGIIQSFLPVIMQVVMALVPVVQQVFAQLGPILSQLMPIIAELAGLWRDALLSAIQALLPVLPPILTAVGQVVAILGGALLQVIQQLAPIIPVLVGTIAQLAGAIGGALGAALAAIAPVLPKIAQVVGQVATMFAGLLASVLQALLPVLPPLVDALLQIATVVIGAVMGALEAILPLIPQLVNLFVMLVNAALVPLLPLLPMIAGLISTIITAIAPMLPLIVQVVALLIQLAISALMPMMPIIEMVIRLVVGLVGALMPIVQVLLTVVGGFIRFQAVIMGVVIGFVQRIIGLLGGLVTWFVSIPTRILGALGNFGTLLFSKGAELIQGLVNGIAHAASFVGDVAKSVVNSIIRWINDHIIDGINGLLEFSIAGIDINPPDIPHIPTLHEGGVFDSGHGEGLAVLRDQELVATPQQRVIADTLLRDLLSGQLPATASAGGGPVIGELHEHVHQAPGEPVAAVAARVTQNVVWRLNGGITRTVGREAVAV